MTSPAPGKIACILHAMLPHVLVGVLVLGLGWFLVYSLSRDTAESARLERAWVGRDVDLGLGTRGVVLSLAGRTSFWVKIKKPFGGVETELYSLQFLQNRNPDVGVPKPKTAEEAPPPSLAPKQEKP